MGFNCYQCHAYPQELGKYGPIPRVGVGGGGGFGQILLPCCCILDSH